MSTRGAELGHVVGARLRAGPPVRFRGGLHGPRTATAVGRLLGVAVLLCFLTGLLSHLLQDPPGWLAPHLPTRPVWGYRVTQGLHVASGLAAIPLLLTKLWTVYPRLFEWPPVRGVRHGLERLSIAVLVSTVLLQLFMGLLNTLQWYPWPFSFREVHWALAWVLTGSLLLHVAVKAPQIAAHWRRGGPGDDTGATAVVQPADEQPASHRTPRDAERDRRSLLLGTGAAVAAVTTVTVGQSVTPLRRLILFAPRSPDAGSQDLPVNRSARAAKVSQRTVQDWRLTVEGPRRYQLSLAELRELPQHDVELPIACVEGWSKYAQWSGVRVSDLLDRAGAPPDAKLRVTSLEQSGAYRVMEMSAAYTRDPLTLLALRLNGAVLNLNHGYPARIIAPDRPGVLQTKWVHRMEVLECEHCG